MRLVNYCFSSRINIGNISTTLFLSINENKNTANAYTYCEKYNKVQYIACKNYIFFHKHLELNYKSFHLNVIFSHYYFQYILQLIYQ